MLPILVMQIGITVSKFKRTGTPDEWTHQYSGLHHHYKPQVHLSYRLMLIMSKCGNVKDTFTSHCGGMLHLPVSGLLYIT